MEKSSENVSEPFVTKKREKDDCMSYC